MPHHCVAPKCHNNSVTSPGLSFHRLPLGKPELLKKWLIKIRRENMPLKEDSRVCGVHFSGGRRQGINDVPEIFAWTKPIHWLPTLRRNSSAI